VEDIWGLRYGNEVEIGDGEMGIMVYGQRSYMVHSRGSQGEVLFISTRNGINSITNERDGKRIEFTTLEVYA